MLKQEEMELVLTDCISLNQGIKTLQSAIQKREEHEKLSEELLSLVANIASLSSENAELCQKLKSSIENESNLLRPLKLLSESILSPLPHYFNDNSVIPSSLMQKILQLICISKYNNAPLLSQIFNKVFVYGAECPQEVFDFCQHILTLFPGALHESPTHPGYIFKPEEKQVEFTACPICGCNESTAYNTAFSFLMEDFNNPFLPHKLWMECGNCKDMYSRFMPEFYCTTQDGQKLINPQENEKVIFKPSSKNLNIWSNILNTATKQHGRKTVLEVGIGHGELIAVALEMGYQVDAVELEEEVAQRVATCLNMPIWCCDFLKFETEKKYSTIIMGDVIEHVLDPIKALEKAYDLLEDDGILWLSTPNYKSSYSRLQGDEYVMWKEPYHLTFFSYDGLEVLLKKVGFELEEYTVSDRYLGCMELFLKKSHK